MTTTVTKNLNFVGLYRELNYRILYAGSLLWAKYSNLGNALTARQSKILFTSQRVLSHTMFEFRFLYFQKIP